ncbi:MAG: CDP-alcohol phosphatidyltransferase family protein [Micromonosporaceae bacterium]|nr:CDP-alcohol phosphatidyltransferase family protein [Micromonosporaceae bacterium]
MRRGGSLARQVLQVARITRHDRAAGAAGTTALVSPSAATSEELTPRRGRLASIRRVRKRDSPGATAIRENALSAGLLPIPVSPAVPALSGPAPAGPLTIPLLPGDRTVARRLRFALVNACTLASLSLGMVAIFLAFSAERVHWAALALIACVVFDGLDGALARKLGVASPFGAQMDSLADMCSFGVAAPVVVYAWLEGSAPAAMVAPACALVAICAAIRLARFNVSPKDGRFFCGVPTTMAAAVLAIGTLVAPSMPSWLRIAAISLLALAMVSSFPYAKLARLLRLPPWLLIVPVIGLLLDYRLTYALVVLAYLVSGPLIWLSQRRAAALA